MKRSTTFTSPKFHQSGFLIDAKELSERFVIRHQYDPQNTLRNMSSFKGTVVEMVFAKSHFWILILKHVLIFLGWKFAPDDFRDEIHEYWNLREGYISSLSSLVVFTIVFYTGNCYVTYKDLYNFGMDVQTHIILIASHLKAVLTRGDEVWASIRFFLAAQRVYYYVVKINLAKYSGLKEGDEGHPPLWSTWAEENLIQRGLLTPHEAETLGEFDGDKPSLLASWGEHAFLEHSTTNPRFDTLSAPAQAQYLARFMAASEQLQSKLMATTSTKQFGVPFVYHHIVHITCTLYLVLQSVGSIFIEPEDAWVCYWSLITYPIIAFVMLGILSAADAMADPFGDDDCDFNLDALTQHLYSEIGKLCALDDDSVLAEISAKRYTPQRVVEAKGGGSFLSRGSGKGSFKLTANLNGTAKPLSRAGSGDIAGSNLNGGASGPRVAQAEAAPVWFNDPDRVTLLDSAELSFAPSLATSVALRLANGGSRNKISLAGPTSVHKPLVTGSNGSAGGGSSGGVVGGSGTPFKC